MSSKSFTVGLYMIVKDESYEDLKPLFASIPPKTFNEMLVGWNGSNEATRRALEAFGCKVIKIKWEDDFSKARNHVFDEGTCDLQVWMDSDDELQNGKELLTTLLNAFRDPMVKVLEMPYFYDHDKYGNCVMKLWNARVVRRGTFQWVGACHEALLPTEDFKKCRVENVSIKHRVDPARVGRSAERNLRIFAREYKKEHELGGIDPRTTLYYAKSLNGMGMFAESVEIFEEYLEQSEWDDEKYEVLCTLADFHTRSRQYFKAQDYARRALTLRPQYGLAYFELAETYYRLEKWQECAHFIGIGLNQKMPDALLPVDPSEYNFRPLLALEYALFQMGNTQGSLQVIEELLKLQPKNEHVLARKKSVLEFLARIELERSSITLMQWLEKSGEKDKIRHLLEALPEVVQDHPQFVRIANGYKTADGAKNRLTIY